LKKSIEGIHNTMAIVFGQVAYPDRRGLQPRCHTLAETVHLTAYVCIT